jgi:diguanylate cyclase (GGDEF)-like protein
VIDGGENRTIEQPTRLPDGSSGWLSTLKAVVRDDGGRVVGLITHNRDITQRKMLQLKLEATQAQFDEALANMSDGLAMYDRAGVFLFCNRRYQELFPLTAHLRIPGTSFADIIRASVELGEERLPAGVSLEEHVAAKVAAVREDGEKLIELVDGRRLSSRTKIVANGSTLMVVSDVTERWHFQKDLEYQALHDPLTGLPNRAYFNREFGRYLELARRAGGALVVMLVDLDHFKEVNDRFGHPAGDALLVEVSRRLEKAVRRGDLVARLGGDEFAILMSGPASAVTDVGLAARVSRSFTLPMRAGDVTLQPSGSVGYTMFPRDNSDAEGLLRNADRALYLAKNRRRGSWVEYDPDRPDEMARAG